VGYGMDSFGNYAVQKKFFFFEISWNLSLNGWVSRLIKYSPMKAEFS
jgi:hypothetical protein